MNWLVRLWSALLDWLFRRETKAGRPYLTEVVEGEYPSELAPDVIYVLTEDGDPWEAKFLCPCGCGVHLELNLLSDIRPAWTVRQGVNGRASVHPSVWRTVGCRSHFWIREGGVQWTTDGGVA